jgi:hypothetical protein
LVLAIAGHASPFEVRPTPLGYFVRVIAVAQTGAATARAKGYCECHHVAFHHHVVFFALLDKSLKTEHREPNTMDWSEKKKDVVSKIVQMHTCGSDSCRGNVITADHLRWRGSARRSREGGGVNEET